MQGEAQAVVNEIFSEPTHCTGMTNGLVEPRVTETVMAQHVRSVYARSSSDTRSIYNRARSADGECWIIRMFIFRAIAQMRVARAQDEAEDD